MNAQMRTDIDLGPILCSWASWLLSGKDAIKFGTNFTIAESCVLWNHLQHIIMPKWNVGSGKRSMVHPMDTLLICLVQLKQEVIYNIASKGFDCSSLKMCRLINSFVKKVGMTVYDHLLATRSMLEYQAKEAMCKKFPDCLEAININLQMSYQQGNNSK